MTTRTIIGLASGSSADGVDAALFEAEGAGLDLRVQPVFSLHQAYARELRDLIRRLSEKGSDPLPDRRISPVQDGYVAPQGGGLTPFRTSLESRQVAVLHRLLGETFAAAARQVADRASTSLQKVQCLGCPGHTIGHEPEGRFPSTLALGMAGVVAERTGVTTVSDFRSRDLVLGGQGFPLVTLPDYLMFRHSQENRALVHLGGLARITYLPAAGPRGAGFKPAVRLVGFEAGPCNLLLDGLIRHLTAGKDEFDAGGKHAVQGQCKEALLQRWLSHPYFHRRPPKSFAWHKIGDEFILQAVQMARQMEWSLHDILCTATHLVAESISNALRRFLPEGRQPDRVLLCGRGVRNGLLWRFLEQQLAGIPVNKTDQFGVPADARKALGFGILAVLTVDGVPANIPSATGAAGSRLLGSLTPGSSANWARCVSWMAAQTSALATEDE